METEAKVRLRLVMTRNEARKILKRHRGSMAALATACEVTPATVTLVLKGRMKSQRVLEAAIAKATELAGAPGFEKETS